jgi:hypothetical protein
LIAAGVYAACGVVFGYLSAHAASQFGVLAWRWSAWAVSATTFGWQIIYERRLGSPRRTTARHAASAAALGALGLAALALHHSISEGRHLPPLLMSSVVVWPVIVFVPAFIVAWLAASAISAHPGGAEGASPSDDRDHER